MMIDGSRMIRGLISSHTRLYPIIPNSEIPQENGESGVRSAQAAISLSYVPVRDRSLVSGTTVFSGPVSKFFNIGTVDQKVDHS